VKFATALLTCSCGSSFQMVCEAIFNSSVVSAGVYTFPTWRPRRDSPAGSNLNTLGVTLIVLNQLVCFQPVLHDARTLINRDCPIINWHRIAHRFSVIAEYWSNYRFWQGVPPFSAINHILPNTRFCRPHFCRRQYGSVFNHFDVIIGPQSYKPKLN